MNTFLTNTLYFKRIETTSCVCVYCHQFLYSNKHIFLVIVMNIFSFLLYFWKEKKISYLLYQQDYKLYSILIVYQKKKKKHHARYLCQSVLYNGESRISNYDDLLWFPDHRLGTEVDRGQWEARVAKIG